jgi:hypothetical protein
MKMKNKFWLLGLVLIITLSIIGLPALADAQLDNPDFYIVQYGWLSKTPSGYSLYLGGCSGGTAPPICAPVFFRTKYTLTP